MDLNETLGIEETWNLKSDEVYHIYFDESNNCRKFWIKDSTGKFNTNYDADFVLGGIAYKGEEKIVSLEEMVELLDLQHNIKEIKFNRHFSKGTFLECINQRRLYLLLSWLKRNHIFTHYLNINNLYYAIVEIIDSITSIDELKVNVK